MMDGAEMFLKLFLGGLVLVSFILGAGTYAIIDWIF